MFQKESKLIQKDSKVITKVLSSSLVSLISSHSVFSFLVCTCRVPMHFSEILTPTLFVHRVLASDWKNRVVCDLWWFYSFSDGQIGAFSGWVLRVFIALEIQDKKVNHMHISISCDKWYIPQCWKSLKSLIWISNMLVIKFFSVLLLTLKHTVWKIHKISRLNFSFLAFFTNFCPIKMEMSGSTVWPQISGFQKLALMDHFWHFY